MQKKAGLKKLVYFLLFIIAIFLVYLLIKYNWDFNKVVEHVTNLIG